MTAALPTPLAAVSSAPTHYSEPTELSLAPIPGSFRFVGRLGNNLRYARLLVDETERKRLIDFKETTSAAFVSLGSAFPIPDLHRLIITYAEPNEWTIPVCQLGPERVKTTANMAPGQRPHFAIENCDHDFDYSFAFSFSSS